MGLKNESKYIGELKKGNRAAFDVLYEHYAPRLYGYSVQWTKSHEKAEGIVQDVFMKLWIKRASIRCEESISHFLFTTAKFQLINVFRKNLSSPVFVEYVQCKEEGRFSTGGADDAINYDEFCAIIEHIKRGLPITQQRVFDYRVIKQLKIEEIADIMNLSKQTVRNQLSLALKVFRTGLDRYVWVLLLILWRG